MDGHRISLLGTGLIGDFYTMTLHGQRGRDRVRVVYSRSAERGKAFRDRWDIPESTTDLDAAIEHPETDVVIVALPNFLHEETVAKVRETERREREVALRENGFWLGSLVSYLRAGWDPRDILRHDELLAEVTRENLAAAARRYLDRGRYVQGTLLPAAPAATP